MRRNPYVYDSDDEEPENTQEELQTIYDNIGNMIDYVAKRYLRERLYAYNETYTRIYMFDYYKRKLGIIVNINVLINLQRNYAAEIQQRVNLSPDAIKEQKYNTYIKYVRGIIRDKSNNKTKISSDALFKSIKPPEDPTIKRFRITDDDKRKLYDEYLQLYNNKHPKQPKPVKISFNEKLDNYVGLHHSANDLLDYEQFEQLTNSWNEAVRTKTTREYYNLYLEKYYKLSKQIKTDIVPFTNTHTHTLLSYLVA